MSSLESSINHPQDTYSLIIATPADRQKYAREIVFLEQQEWKDIADEPDDINNVYFDPRAVLVLLTQKNKLIGFTCALPADYEDQEGIPRKIRGKKDIAYIQNTQIAPGYRQQKLVGLLMERLEEELKDRGYRCMARDSVIENGYADSVQKHYRDRIIRSFDHRSPFGPQRYFEIQL